VKIAPVAGIILIGLGALSLAYFASPVRLLFQATLEQHKINPIPPIYGGIALVTGIAILFSVRPRRSGRDRE
jgi:multisubunit Na+/H+ antiporter MnhB subunit